MVYVFPDPVCPYAKQLALPFLNRVCTRGAMVVLYTSSFDTDSSKDSSKLNWCFSMYLVRSTWGQMREVSVKR
jgi:hypothetical protein